jgi:hypothetical protein
MTRSSANGDSGSGGLRSRVVECVLGVELAQGRRAEHGQDDQGQQAQPGQAPRRGGGQGGEAVEHEESLPSFLPSLFPSCALAALSPKPARRATSPVMMRVETRFVVICLAVRSGWCRRSR